VVVKITFSETLKKLRNEKNISQKKLAEALFISQQAIAKWETDKASPNPEMITKIADYFNVSADYLLGKEDSLPAEKSSATEADLKVALFGGDSEVTDEMWDEVKRFAEFVKQNKGKK